MVVVALRVWMPGTDTVAVGVIGTLIEPIAEISLTSGATFRLTRSPMIVGVMARLMPNCLYCTVIVLVRPPWGTRIGISPPARKLAVSPDIATRSGSARIVAWLFVARKSMTPLRSLLLYVTVPDARPPVDEIVDRA